MMNSTQLQPTFKRYPIFTLILTLFVLVLSACAQGDVDLGSLESGPKAWIEYPPEGETFTMGTIPIVVYAASPQGVQGISVSINGRPAPVGNLEPLAGDNTMVRMEINWQPPAEGKYRIAASAGGAPASLTFCVVTCETSAPAEESPVQLGGSTVTASPTLPLITLPPNITVTASLTPPPPTITPSPTVPVTAIQPPTITPSPTVPPSTPTFTPTVITYSEPSADFWASPTSINQGECTTLNWNVYGDFQAVYFEGNPVGGSGSDSECPASSYTYHLQVVDMYGGTYDYWASVDVAAAPVDTSGPSVNWTNLTWESCQFFGEAGISDESGVTWAKFYYNLNGGGWNSVWMSELSTDYWQADIGIPVGGSEIVVGTVEYYIVASDGLGNESTSGTSSYSYSSCDG